MAHSQEQHKGTLTMNNDQLYPVVTIAQGTPWETSVLDVRGAFTWTFDTGLYRPAERLIVYHHTASAPARLTRTADRIARMQVEAGSDRYGLPYNFIFWPNDPPAWFYLNGVDGVYPHTYGFNWATAIAVWGNFNDDEPDPLIPTQMMRLADALAAMWDRYVPEKCHRDLYATACPGEHLWALLSRDPAPF
jgi:hypothetical protein